MFPFENETLQQIEKFNKRKVLIELEFMDGDKLFAYGLLKATNTVININHQSEKMPTFDDLMSDFHIQILNPSPVMTLLNITRFNNGKEVGSDQTGLNSFKLLDPSLIYEDFPADMIANLQNEEGNTVVIIPETSNIFPTPPFNNHTGSVSKNGMILKTKSFNGYLKVSSKEIIIDNQCAEHYPKWDLGYEPESDYFAILRFRKGYTLEYIDKASNEFAEINIDSFQFFGQSNIK